ncbi:terminase small subunit [Mucilaginibacter sp. HMF5004]|uniref:terminase small subunit n=1 Tax=Mucilaginibacter rivuli TaxID=2857527 RepID=UPI001C5FD2DA|nr:terminase small subunit [Mucilaginibacter rivuli]MBW4890004.1 terminase small subunit [Mucilaginibacter rivuli]
MAILESLSYKQQKFCEEYLLNFNAYRAALTAGYTDNTARKGDLLHVPKIQAYLKEAMNRSAARAELTHDMLLRELMKVAFCNMGNYYDDHGDPKRMHQLTDDEKAAISYFQRADVTGEDGHITGELFKIKLHNKMAAIDKLCRHTGFYKANWQPNVVIQPEETDEDVAFEAESAKTMAEPFSDEVSGELLEQSLGEMQEVRGKNQDEEWEDDDLDIGDDVNDKLLVSGIMNVNCDSDKVFMSSFQSVANPLAGGSRIINPDQRKGYLTTPSLGKGAAGGVMAGRGCFAMMHTKFTPPSTLPLGGNRAMPMLPSMLTINETGLYDKSPVGDPSFANTPSPKGYGVQSAMADVDNILTLSPLDRIKIQESRTRRRYGIGTYPYFITA